MAGRRPVTVVGCHCRHPDRSRRERSNVARYSGDCAMRIITFILRHGWITARLRWLAANDGVAMRLAGRYKGLPAHTTLRAGG